MKFLYTGPCAHEKHGESPAIEAVNVCTGYPGGNRGALRDFTIKIEQGSRVALVGANGAGKSTVLKTIAGLLPIISGSMRVFGHKVGGCVHQVAYLPQWAAIDWAFPVTVFRFLLAGRFVHLGWFKRPTTGDFKHVEAVLELLQLTSLKDTPIQHLSGGQRQRVLLGRALVHEADLFLLDEPLNAVDAANRVIISKMLNELQTKGKTVLMATHDLDGLESEFNEAIFMQDGRQVKSPFLSIRKNQKEGL